MTVERKSKQSGISTKKNAVASLLRTPSSDQKQTSESPSPTESRSSARKLPLLLLAASLTSCATYSPVLVRPPPPAPELMVAPTENYSESAQLKLRAWRQRLIDWQAKQEACRGTPSKCA